MLKRILEAGTLVGEDMGEKVSALSQDHVDFFLSVKEKPLVFDENVWRAVTKPEIKIIKKKFKADKQSVQDLVNKYNDRYNVLKEELLRKSELQNLVSVSSLTDGVDCSVIGIFDGKNIEDQTGQVELDLGNSKEIINTNEVVGLVGEKTDSRFLVNNIVYPDISAREIKKVKHPAKVFIGNRIVDDRVKSVNYAIIKEEQKLPERVSSIQLNGYGEFEIQGIRFLIVKEALGNLVKINKDNKEQELSREILRRRNLFYKDMWVKDVPDVFVTLAKETFVENYKGTTIIGMGEKSVILDLQTRKWTI